MRPSRVDRCPGLALMAKGLKADQEVVAPSFTFCGDCGGDRLGAVGRGGFEPADASYLDGPTQDRIAEVVRVARAIPIINLGATKLD